MSTINDGVTSIAGAEASIPGISPGVDTVIRGTDLLPSTLLQLHIAQLLGRTEFSEVRFLHHPLVVGPDGRKLSKSNGAISLRHWRESGRPPQEVHALAERLVHSGTDIRLTAFATG